MEVSVHGLAKETEAEGAPAVLTPSPFSQILFAWPPLWGLPQFTHSPKLFCIRIPLGLQFLNFFFFLVTHSKKYILYCDSVHTHTHAGLAEVRGPAGKRILPNGSNKILLKGYLTEMKAGSGNKQRLLRRPDTGDGGRLWPPPGLKGQREE